AVQFSFQPAQRLNDHVEKLALTLNEASRWIACYRKNIFWPWWYPRTTARQNLSIEQYPLQPVFALGQLFHEPLKSLTGLWSATHAQMLYKSVSPVGFVKLLTLLPDP